MFFECLVVSQASFAFLASFSSRYKVVGSLGSGTYGTVHEGIRRSDGMTVKTPFLYLSNIFTLRPNVEMHVYCCDLYAFNLIYRL